MKKDKIKGVGDLAKEKPDTNLPATVQPGQTFAVAQMSTAVPHRTSTILRSSNSRRDAARSFRASINLRRTTTR